MEKVRSYVELMRDTNKGGLRNSDFSSNNNNLKDRAKDNHNDNKISNTTKRMEQVRSYAELNIVDSCDMLAKGNSFNENFVKVGSCDQLFGDLVRVTSCEELPPKYGKGYGAIGRNQQKQTEQDKLMESASTSWILKCVMWSVWIVSTFVYMYCFKGSVNVEGNSNEWDDDGISNIKTIIDDIGHNVSMAFIGNSIMWKNDLPRVMEYLGRDRIRQNSCLHGGRQLRTILRYGNGMAHHWDTNKSVVVTTSSGEVVRDFGACTVRQLVVGHDEYIAWNNSNHYYINDGKNPCFNTSIHYFNYTSNKFQTDPPQWDFVIMNDQTRVPAIWFERSRTEQVLREVYAPLFVHESAQTDSQITMSPQPVFLMTWAYHRNVSRERDDLLQYDLDLQEQLSDIPTYTSLLYQGYRSYVDILTSAMANISSSSLSSSKALIAPVGLAYLVLWEEDRNMWEKLFYADGYHPTEHGTFLSACVVYATVFGALPELYKEDFEGLGIWERSRLIFHNRPLPTHEEALYLRHIAERVVLQGKMPQTLDLFTDSYQ